MNGDITIILACITLWIGGWADTKGMDRAADILTVAGALLGFVGCLFYLVN